LVLSFRHRRRVSANVFVSLLTAGRLRKCFYLFAKRFCVFANVLVSLLTILCLRKCFYLSADGIVSSTIVFAFSPTAGRLRRWFCFMDFGRFACDDRLRAEEQILPEFSQSLTELERRLLLRYIAGWKYGQMAEETGMPESTLRSQITRIKEKYKKEKSWTPIVQINEEWVSVVPTRRIRNYSKT
jgi:hypothetical protein